MFLILTFFLLLKHYIIENKFKYCLDKMICENFSFSRIQLKKLNDYFSKFEYKSYIYLLIELEK
jgi:hypothetical protein